MIYELSSRPDITFNFGHFHSKLRHSTNRPIHSAANQFKTNIQCDYGMASCRNKYYTLAKLSSAHIFWNNNKYVAWRSKIISNIDFIYSKTCKIRRHIKYTWVIEVKEYSLWRISTYSILLSQAYWWPRLKVLYIN